MPRLKSVMATHFVAQSPKAWRSWFNLMSAHVPDDVTPSTPQSTLEDAERHCILHTDNQPPKKPRLHILPFTDATWNAVQKSASNRKQKNAFSFIKVLWCYSDPSRQTIKCRWLPQYLLEIFYCGDNRAGRERRAYQQTLTVSIGATIW